MRAPNFFYAPCGIVIYFCNGAHVIFPAGNNVFHLTVSSATTGDTVFDGNVQCQPSRPVEFKTRQTYFVPWKIRITRDGKTICLYEYNPSGRKICINMLLGALGDMVAWMPAVTAFKYFRNAKLTVLMKKEYIPLFDRAYPDIVFTDNADLPLSDFYAIYPVGVWGYGNLDNNPVDFQKTNLVRHAASILGVEVDPALPPELSPVPATTETKNGRYVCIATRASRKMKEWNCPDGWKKVVSFLKKNGYRVLCIDGDDKNLPAGAEKCMGMRPLTERVQLLRGCDFFIGLASGLSWIAWAAKKPVVLISGCTEKFVEFPTPYRIIDEKVCHGCYNAEDMRFEEFDRCPRNRNYECTRAISGKQVISVIETIPEFREAVAAAEK
ncbi:MAG: autotransporter strand-loop-strand O-heptosyltransferase [Victivallaceae bacterium]|nr:autotransporter strand-loop-strand O-heptosyltransferase [Victivallaceae bacterium]